MKIAIHNRKGSFSDLWIQYCEEHNIEYKLVDAFSNDIIQQLKDCDIFMWHFHHAIYKDMIHAKTLLTSLEISGKIVFPSVRTCYTFDDKVSQKYQLESVGAEIVPTYVFFDRENALNWVQNTSFPKVFKLTGGAGASNVKLLRSRREAKKHINKLFSKGIKTYHPLDSISEHWRRYRLGHFSLITFAKRALLSLRKSEFKRFKGREVGYAYFQDFIPDNTGDIRVVIIGNKAFGLKRQCREGDFRASGSGIIDYSKIPTDAVSIAFDVSRKLGTDCIAFDFIYDQDHKPLIVEISYGFTASAYFECGGYWDHDMIWHDDKINPGFIQIEYMIDKYNHSRHNL